MTSLSRSDTFVSSCTWSRDEYGTNINQSKFTVSHFQAAWSERLSTPCHVCSWHEEKAALVHALWVFGVKGGITRIFFALKAFLNFWPHPSSSSPKKDFIIGKKGHLVLIGLIHLPKPSCLWLLFVYYLDFLLSSFPAKQNIWASLCLDLGLCNNSKKKNNNKKTRFTSIRFSLLQKNSALRANARGVENTSTSAARYQPQDNESKIQ